MSDQNHWNWLSEKLPSWVEQGVLDPETAERLRQQKPPFEEGSRSHLSTRILLGISALLFGLGVISFFAFNWDDMSKALKLGVIFGAFLGAHGAGCLLSRNPAQKSAAEFCHLLGSFLFGSAVFLIAQIYQIEEHAPNGILLWALGVGLMAYVLNSTPQMLLFSVLTVVWQGMERCFDAEQWLGFLFSTTVMIPFAMRKKHAFVVSVVTCSILVQFFIQLSFFTVGFVGDAYFLGTLALGLGVWIRRRGFESCARPVELMGYLLYFFAMIFFAHQEGVREGLFHSFWRENQVSENVLTFLSLLALGSWTSFAFPTSTFAERFLAYPRKHVFVVLLGFVWMIVIWTLPQLIHIPDERAVWCLLASFGFNALALFHGILLIFSGTRLGRVSQSFSGALLLVCVILVRFVAATDDLLLRSFAFMVCGAFMLWIALKTSRIKQKRLSHE